MEAVLDKAAERGVVVEVNGKPERLDLKTEHVRQALQRGVKLVVSCDAHRAADLGNLAFAVATARRGWARKGRHPQHPPRRGLRLTTRCARLRASL